MALQHAVFALDTMFDEAYSKVSLVSVTPTSIKFIVETFATEQLRFDGRAPVQVQVLECSDDTAEPNKLTVAYNYLKAAKFLSALDV